MNPWEALTTPPTVLLRRHAEILKQQKPKPRAPRTTVKHKAGDVVGEWTLLEFLPGQRSPRVQAKWHCRCSCGVERDVQTSNLLTGGSTSCGHGMSKHLSERATARPRACNGTFAPKGATNV